MHNGPKAASHEGCSNRRIVRKSSEPVAEQRDNGAAQAATTRGRDTGQEGSRVVSEHGDVVDTAAAYKAARYAIAERDLNESIHWRQ